MSSLRFRLMAANVLVKQVVIFLAALYLIYVFDNLARHLIDSELRAHLGQIAAAARTTPDPSSLGRRTFDTHWQLSRGATVVAGSQSLAGDNIVLPESFSPPLNAAAFDARTERGRALLASAEVVDASVSPPLIVIAAQEASELAELHGKFRWAVILALGGIAALLLTSAWLQVNVGLRPAELLRSNIERIRLGKARRLDNTFPDELRPLIDETNRLLEVQERAIEQARTRASDLAHGLKTPLSAVTALAEQVHEAVDRRLAREILKNVDLAYRHLERELSRTRIAASSGLVHETALLPCVNLLRQTVEHLPGGDELDYEISIEPSLSVNVEEADVVEICGCLFDNARKWAASNVAVSATSSGNFAVLCVEDDGPGVAEADFAEVLRRGMRLDESKPGTGLGLTIVKDIVEAYGGAIELYRAPAGGLGVRLMLPQSIALNEVQLPTPRAKPASARIIGAASPGATTPYERAPSIR